MEKFCNAKGLRELSENELHGTNGGGLGIAIVAGIVGAIVAEVLSDWENFTYGLRGLPELKN